MKALANLLAGRLSDVLGRKGVLVTGWLVGIPVPLLLMFAPSWNWIVLANVLLGANQGLCWSTTVIMKIDLVGPEKRGLAMGLNEAAGYLAVSAAALASGYIAGAYGLRPQPFYLSLFLALGGLLVSTFHRLWRDSGYALGALLAGVTADLLGLRWAIVIVALLTLASGVIVAAVMRETVLRNNNAVLQRPRLHAPGR